jgi:hypothetical protein
MLVATLLCASPKRHCELFCVPEITIHGLRQPHVAPLIEACMADRAHQQSGLTTPVLMQLCGSIPISFGGNDKAAIDAALARPDGV